MSKKNKKTDEKTNLINERVSELKEDFNGLTDYKKILLAYREILELNKRGRSLEESLEEYENVDNEVIKLSETDELLSIVRASDFNVSYIKGLLLYYICDCEKKYRELYKESLISYNKVLENYKVLAQELKLKNTLDISHLFTYMLWNGYYSVTKQHAYKLQERLFLPGMYSFDVIKGKGVCLAYAELLHNYLTKCDKSSALLQCKVPIGKNKIIRDYTPNINRNIESSLLSKLSSKTGMVLLTGLINTVGNHAVTLIEDNNKIYVYDPTNLYVLNVIDKDTASIINGKGNYDIKPFSSIILTPNSDPNYLFEKLLTDNIEPAFTRKEIIFSFENVLEVINNNLGLLDDAYDNIHSKLEVIDRETNEFGGGFKALKKKRINKN